MGDSGTRAAKSPADTRRAVAYARDAEKLGADGLMLLPAMVYVPKPEELIAHFRTVAEAIASEHGARMTSMSSATENAGPM